MDDMKNLVMRLESAVTRLEKMGPTLPISPRKPSSQSNGGITPTEERRNSRSWQQWGEQSTVPFVTAFDTLLSGPFKHFLDKSNEVGEEVAAMGKLVEAAFKTQRAFLVAASKSKKPTPELLPKAIEATGKGIETVIAFREKSRSSPFFNHLSTVSESIPGLSWVVVEPAPAPFVREMLNAAVFYSNRVLKDYREKDKLHVEWVNSWTAVMTELSDYVKQHHTTGTSWNPLGSAALKGAPPPPPGGVPPPPPMAPLDLKKIEGDSTAKLFEDLNKGLEITSKLKKITDDQKTHKNPSLREGPKPFVKAPAKEPKPAKKEVVVKPPRLALEGKKWFVEHQKDNKSIVIKDTSMEHSVYIYKCQDSVIQVKKKINSIILDSCKKTAVVFDSLVSSLEIVNCQSCQAQVINALPTVAIEKTDGAQIYLSKDSLHCEIVSAKSSEMNILLPNEDGSEFTEQAVPEQFKTVIEEGKLVTTCTEKAG